MCVPSLKMRILDTKSNDNIIKITIWDSINGYLICIRYIAAENLKRDSLLSLLVFAQLRQLLIGKFLTVVQVKITPDLGDT